MGHLYYINNQCLPSGSHGSLYTACMLAYNHDMYGGENAFNQGVRNQFAFQQMTFPVVAFHYKVDQLQKMFFL